MGSKSLMREFVADTLVSELDGGEDDIARQYVGAAKPHKGRGRNAHDQRREKIRAGREGERAISNGAQLWVVRAGNSAANRGG